MLTLGSQALMIEEHELIPLSDVSASRGEEQARLIEMIRNGILEGRKIGDDWFVYPTACAELDRERRSVGGGDLHQRRRPPLHWLVMCFAGASSVWLSLIPVFAANAGHFGWGFFPVLTTKAASPIIPILTFISLLWVRSGRSPGKAIPWWLLPVLCVSGAGWVYAYVLLWHL